MINQYQITQIFVSLEDSLTILLKTHYLISMVGMIGIIGDVVIVVIGGVLTRRRFGGTLCRRDRRRRRFAFVVVVVFVVDLRQTFKNVSFLCQ